MLAHPLKCSLKICQMISALFRFDHNMINVDFDNRSIGIMKNCILRTLISGTNILKTKEHYDLFVNTKGSRTPKNHFLNIGLIIASMAIHKRKFSWWSQHQLANQKLALGIHP